MIIAGVFRLCYAEVENSLVKLYSVQLSNLFKRLPGLNGDIMRILFLLCENNRLTA